ncbi:MAG: hypothetical protein JWQ98_193 [Chlorobi bacterium]|nr:hypothetical protein [Chlorobiota bacterium]
MTISLALSLFLLAGVPNAQTYGTLTGSVRDSAGKPLRGGSTSDYLR